MASSTRLKAWKMQNVINQVNTNRTFSCSYGNVWSILYRYFNLKIRFHFSPLYSKFIKHLKNICREAKELFSLRNWPTWLVSKDTFCSQYQDRNWKMNEWKMNEKHHKLTMVRDTPLLTKVGTSSNVSRCWTLSRTFLFFSTTFLFFSRTPLKSYLMSR